MHRQVLGYAATMLLAAACSTEDVRRLTDGPDETRAHGLRDMPVWGWQFYDIPNPADAYERAAVDSMIGRLIEYLRSIQSDT